MAPPGRWKREKDTPLTGDSCLRTDRAGDNPFRHVTELALARIVRPEPEPAYNNVTVRVEFEEGFEKGTVGWPGPNVCVGPSGQNDGSSIGIHGFYDGPLPGQEVLVGFVGGQANAPIVVQKYPHRIDKRPQFDKLHLNPLTTQFHQSDDVLMGGYSGSFVAVRGKFPLPGEVHVSSVSSVLVEAPGGIQMSSVSSVLIEAPSVSLDSASINLGLPAPEQAVLGNILNSFLSSFLAACAAITTAGIPIDNGSAFTALQSSLPAHLSGTVHLAP